MNSPELSHETFFLNFVSSQRICKARLILSGRSSIRKKRRGTGFPDVSFHPVGRAFEIDDKGRPRVRVHGAKAPKELIGRVPNSRSVGFTEHSSLFSSSSSASYRSFVVGVLAVVEVVLFVAVVHLLVWRGCERWGPGRPKSSNSRNLRLPRLPFRSNNVELNWKKIDLLFSRLFKRYKIFITAEGKFNSFNSQVEDGKCKIFEWRS